MPSYQPCGIDAFELGEPEYEFEMGGAELADLPRVYLRTLMLLASPKQQSSKSRRITEWDMLPIISTMDGGSVGTRPSEEPAAQFAPTLHQSPGLAS